MSQRTALVLALTLAGCAPRAPGTQPGTQVEQDWKDTMARLSLTGIHPIPGAATITSATTVNPRPAAAAPSEALTLQPPQSPARGSRSLW